MNWYIKHFRRIFIFKILLKVFYMVKQKPSFAFKIFLNFPNIVIHINHNTISQILKCWNIWENRRRWSVESKSRIPIAKTEGMTSGGFLLLDMVIGNIAISDIWLRSVLTLLGGINFRSNYTVICTFKILSRDWNVINLSWC